MFRPECATAKKKEGQKHPPIFMAQPGLPPNTIGREPTTPMTLGQLWHGLTVHTLLGGRNIPGRKQVLPDIAIGLNSLIDP